MEMKAGGVKELEGRSRREEREESERGCNSKDMQEVSPQKQDLKGTSVETS